MTQTKVLSDSITTQTFLASRSSGGQMGLRIDQIFNVSNALAPTIQKRKATAHAEVESEPLFDAVADAKIWTSRIAMHLDPEDRNRFFRQLDLLHDPDQWFESNAPVRLKSFQGFIDFILQHEQKLKPSLGLGPNGNLHAIWERDDKRLTIEFLDRAHVNWIVSSSFDGEVERAAGTTRLNRLKDVLSPYGPEKLFAYS